MSTDRFLASDSRWRALRGSPLSTSVIAAAALPFLAAGPFGAVYAQQSGQASERPIEEILVTAQKRTQSVMDVGIAMDVFSGDNLRNLDIGESTGIATFSPGVSLSSAAGNQSRQFNIRGVIQNDFADHTESPVAVYVDEGYIAAPQGQVFGLFDIDRVEVLKGPQGTLFGRNATGGLVHYVTNKPTQEFEGFVNLTGGSYQRVRVEGAISGPINENLSARFSAFHDQHDEIIDNVFPEGNTINPLTGESFQPSSSGQDDFFNDDQSGLRAQLLWEPDPDFSLLWSVFAARQEISTGQQQQRAVTPILNDEGNQVDGIFAKNDPQACEAISQSTGECVPISFVDGEIPGINEDATRPVQGGDFFGFKDPGGPLDRTASADHALDNFNRYIVYGSTAKYEWQLENFDLVGISHFVHFDKRQSLDVDASPTPQSLVLQLADHNTASQEIRASGEVEGVQWVAGGYYLFIDTFYSQGLAFSEDSPLSILFFDGTAFESPVFVDLNTHSGSAFAEFEYDLTDTLTLVNGWRVVQEEKEFSFDNFFFESVRDESIDFNQAPLGVPVSQGSGGLRFPSFRGDSSDTLWSVKARLDYHPTEELLVYAGFNRGIKAGGFNAPINDFNPPTDVEDIPYDPEILNAYEVGFKSTLMDGRANLNGSVYYYDYDGYQAFVFSGVRGIIKNSEAKFTGAELQFDITPVNGFEFQLNASFIDAEVKDLEIAEGVFRNVEPVFTPEWQLSALAEYRFMEPWLNGYWTLRMDGQYQDNRFHNLRNFRSSRMGDYAVGNAQISWESAGRPLDAAVFVKNFTDSRYTVGGFELGTLCGCNEEAIGDPITFGIRIGISTQ